MQEGEWGIGGAGQKVKDGIRHMGGTMIRMGRKPKELATQIMIGQGKRYPASTQSPFRGFKKNFLVIGQYESPSQ